MYIVQSVLVPKDKFTLKKAKQYIKKNHELQKVDVSPNYYRFRQKNPKTKHKAIKTITLKNGVKEIVYY